MTFIALVIIYLVYKYITKPQLVAWDEAGFIWLGYQFHKLIEAGEWSDFWKLTRVQVSYPFFQGWYLGFLTLPFKYSINIARLVSLFLLLPTAWVFWLMAKELDSKSRVLPVLASGLFLTSPLVLFLFSGALKEGLGLFFTLLSLWFFWLSRKEANYQKSLFWYLLTSLSLLVLTFVKNYYGAYVLVILGIESLFWLSAKKNYRKFRGWLTLAALFLFPGLVLIYWVFILPGNFQTIWREFFQNLGDYPTSLWGHFLYYPQEMAFSYCFSWPAFLILAFGFIWVVIKHHGDFKLRTLAGLFLLNFIMAMKMVHKNQGRYHFTTVPALFLAGSFGLIQFWPEFKKYFQRPFLRGIFLTLGLFFGAIIVRDLILLPRMIRPTGSHAVGSPIYYELDYQKIERFEFNRKNWAHQYPKGKTERVENIFEFIFANVDASKKVTPVGRSNELSPYIFLYYLDMARDSVIPEKKSFYQEYFVTFEVFPGTRFDTFDFRHFNLSLQGTVKEFLADRRLTKINQKTFPYLGVRVTILAY